MEKAKINAYQLYCLLVLFEFGTALLVPLGMDVRQDAWIAILLGGMGGLLLFGLYVYLFRQYPQLPLTGYLPKILGKYIGWPLGFLYVVFFIYAGARDLRDVGSLLIASVYDRTPLFVLNLLVLFAAAYVIRKGIEVMARTGEIMTASIFAFGLLGVPLVLFSNIMDVHLLLPVLGEGWKPVLTTALTQTWMFPFGETICFTMLLPYLNKPNLAFKTGAAGIAVSALVLSLTISMEITILGAVLTSRSTFPLLAAISKVNIGDFIQHVDALAVFTLIVNNFFKVGLFYYAAAVGTADLFRFPKYQVLLLPIGFIMLISSMMMASNFPEHLKEGKLALKTIFPVFAVALPLILAAAVQIRKRFSFTDQPSDQS